MVRFRVPVRKGRKVKISIAPSIDKKEDFTFLHVQNFRFSWQYYSENPLKMDLINLKLNLKDLPKKVPKGTAKTTKGSRRIVDQNGKLVQDDSNLYKAIASEDELAQRITNIDSLSLEDLRDVIVKLTMINALPNESQVSLRNLHLNLDPSVRRCENIHGSNNCTTVWGTMAVKKCRGGYIRSGCCRCS